MKGTLAIGLVSTATVIIVGLLIYASVYNSMNSTLASINSQELNNTVSNVNTTTYNAFNLLVISLIVLAATAILTYVLFLGS